MKYLKNEFNVIVQSLSYGDHLIYASFLTDSDALLNKPLLELIRSSLIESQSDQSSDNNNLEPGNVDDISNNKEKELLQKELNDLLGSKLFLDLDVVVVSDEDENNAIDVKIPPIRLWLDRNVESRNKNSYLSKLKINFLKSFK